MNANVKNKTVLLSAGGTGGHLFPAVATGEELLVAGYSVHLVTDKRCKKYLSNIKFKVSINDLYLSSNSFIHKIFSPFKIVKSVVHALILLRRIKPSLVVGFGGYPTFPMMIAAKISGIPIGIHEQNSFLGKVNKIFANHTVFLALSYQDTQNIPSLPANRVVYTGPAIREDIKKLPTKEIKEKEEFTILIFGGSQGASFLSSIVPSAISLLVNDTTKINIVQQASNREQKKLKDFYNAMGIEAVIQPFFHNIADLYQSVDLVIARSGASTIAELTHIAMPAIYVPFPYAADDHQYHNAKNLADKNCALVIRQSECSAEILAEKIRICMDVKTRQKMQDNMNKMSSDGSVMLANIISEFINDKLGSNT